MSCCGWKRSCLSTDVWDWQQQKHLVMVVLDVLISQPGVQEFLQCYEYCTVGGVRKGQIPVNCLQQLLPFHFQQLSEGAFM